jgi:hypothetical protein
LEFLFCKEKDYYKKIIDTYYDSNNKSHISFIINENKKRKIIGINFDEDEIINNITNDYCIKIFDEKNDKTKEDLFKIREIVKNLYNNVYQ